MPQVGDPNQASYNQTANKGVVADLQMEIARLALACGRTRVVTLLYEHTNAHNPTDGLGIFGVHDASHFNAPPGQLTGNATPEQITPSSPRGRPTASGTRRSSRSSSPA